MKIIPLSEVGEAAVIPDIIWNGRFGDIEPAGLDAQRNRGGFVSDNAIASAVIICLMTDIRVDETELRDGDINRGWPGDVFDMQGDEVPLGSKLWLLRRSTVDDVKTPRLAEQYAREALDTLIVQGVCVRVEVEAKGYPLRNRLDLEIRLYGRDGSQIFFEKYGVLWEQLKSVSS